MKKIDVVIDALTGEQTETERDETPTEKKVREDLAVQVAKDLADEKANATAKAALLAKLGITAEEAALLLS
jgi:hypothetical protein